MGLTKVKGGFLLDIVVGKGAPVLELLSGEDQALLIRGDSEGEAEIKDERWRTTR